MTKGLYLFKLLLLSNRLTTAELAFMVVVADHLGENDAAWPSYSRLMAQAKIKSRPTIAKLGKSLEAKGFIKITGEGRGSNRYEPVFEAIRESCPPSELAKLEQREQVVQLLNHNGLLAKPPVVYSVNHNSLTSKPERPRERPLESSKGRPPKAPGQSRKRGCPSDSSRGLPHPESQGSPPPHPENLLPSKSQELPPSSPANLPPSRLQASPPSSTANLFPSKSQELPQSHPEVLPPSKAQASTCSRPNNSPPVKLQEVAINDDVRALIIATEAKLKAREFPSSPWHETKGDVTKAITSLESYFITLSLKRGRLPTADELTLAVDSEAFAGIKNLSWGLICSRRIDGGHQPFLLKLEKALAIIMDAYDASQRIGLSLPAGVVKMLRQSPNDPDVQWLVRHELGMILQRRPDNPEVQRWVAAELAKLSS